MKKLKNILLIDDDVSTSRFHEIVIESLSVTENISFARNGREALNYLLSEKSIQPELIFIDLNMPVMNGFRFLELYTASQEFKKNNPKVIVLSTSLITSERERIERDENIFKFLNKPLTKSIISDLIQQNF